MKPLFIFFFVFIIANSFSQNYSVTDEYLKWPSSQKGSTHELAMNDDHFFVTGQNMHHIAKVDHNGGITYYDMPNGSGPHGILFDAEGHLWVSLEFHDQVVQLNKNGKIVKTIDVSLKVPGSKPIGVSPHGIGLGADGKTIWFTGKRTSTVGKINPDGSVEHFELGTLAALPIYLHAGPDGNMWGTELQGNKILRVTPEGKVSEFKIPTYNSRPIAIKPDPNGKYMWFSQEAGKQIGRIDMQGNIKEFQIPYYQPNEILAGLTFDDEGNLWTQSYIDQNNPYPPGTDYIIRLDKTISTTENTDLSNVEVTHFPVPTKKTVMHRIKAGKDGNLYFTELKQDKLGTVKIKKEF